MDEALRIANLCVPYVKEIEESPYGEQFPEGMCDVTSVHIHDQLLRDHNISVTLVSGYVTDVGELRQGFMNHFWIKTAEGINIDFTAHQAARLTKYMIAVEGQPVLLGTDEQICSVGYCPTPWPSAEEAAQQIEEARKEVSSLELDSTMKWETEI
jgi:hypothetical protein